MLWAFLMNEWSNKRHQRIKRRQWVTHKNKKNPFTFISDNNLWGILAHSQYYNAFQPRFCIIVTRRIERPENKELINILCWSRLSTVSFEERPRSTRQHTLTQVFLVWMWSHDIRIFRFDNQNLFRRPCTVSHRLLPGMIVILWNTFGHSIAVTQRNRGNVGIWKRGDMEKEGGSPLNYLPNISCVLWPRQKWNIKQDKDTFLLRATTSV